MRWVVTVVFICGLCAAARGEDPRRTQADAATADARASLRDQVLALPITRDFTVQQLVDQEGGADVLNRALRRADEIGGPRWIDDETCQVHLEINGEVVARAVIEIASHARKRLPLSQGDLKKKVAAWSRRTLSATGTSTAATGVDRLRPADMGGAWETVSEAERRAAMAEARRNAVQRLLASLAPIDLSNGQRLSEALDVPAVGDAVESWVASRPITSVEFREDLSVRLTLSAPPEDLWDVLRPALQRQKAVSLPSGDADWDALRDTVEARVAVPVGLSYARAGAATRQGVAMPAQAPDWAGRALEAEAVARTVGNKLRTARAAEAVALGKLRARIDSLPLGRQLTVGQAARADPKIEEAVDRGMNFAHPYQVDYDDPEAGAVRVKVQLPLAYVWHELAEH